MLLTTQMVKPAVVAFTILLLFVGSILLYSPLQSLPQLLPIAQTPPPHQNANLPTTISADPTLLETDIIQYFEDYPLLPPHKGNFGELGRRTRLLKDFLATADLKPNSPQRQTLINIADQLAVSLYAFLASPPQNPLSTSPLSDLRASFKPGSAGIVIPAGDFNVRFASHLICCLRNVLNSDLPIQIVYAGDDDLSAANRDFLAKLPNTNNAPPITFLDILTVFDDTTLSLRTGGWAIKAFAALGSSFEKVILLDADAVFLQKPETLLQHPAFLRSGAFLFRDRLLWQHNFQDRHRWWKEQIRRPSATLNKSLVWTDDYAEEGDSGVVVVDKSRVDVVAGLLHVCWQNSYDVREEITYKIVYGDKESWWMGFELAGSTYEMEEHYGAIVGWQDTAVAKPDTKRVCSFVIAHLDDKNELIWYNGGLLKNKGIPEMSHEYGVPDKWMVDAEWQKGATKPEMSCMIGGIMHDVPESQLRTLQLSVKQAQWVDEALEIP